MSSSTAALSRTLKTITLTKIKELEKQRKSYARAKDAVLEAACQSKTDPVEKIRCLLKGVEDLGPKTNSKMALTNIRCWLEQSQFDSSFPDVKLKEFEVQLRSELDIQSRKLDLAALYSRLLTEWLNSTNSQEVDADEGIPSLDEPFELVEKDRLKQLTDQFSKVVFTPLETNSDNITDYLDSLFQDRDSTKALDSMRKKLGIFGKLNLEAKPFGENSIQWCLKGLLANDLLRDDKKSILQEFWNDKVAQREICDILNMKWADLKNWDWSCGDEGLPVEPRAQLNGKYRVIMDQDILDAIFLHYIGIVWAVKAREVLKGVVETNSVWSRNVNLPRELKDRRRYYLGEHRVYLETLGNIENARQKMYQADFFLTQLPSSYSEGTVRYDDEEDCEYKDDDKVPRGSNSPSERKSPRAIKQQILKLLATEVQLHKALHGKVAVVQSDFKWFGTAIPHSTIFAVLRFVGIDEDWISLFKKFLEAPLNMGPSSGDCDQVQIRKRGVPMAQALEKFFTEVVLFFLDVAVNQEAGILLYRFHDDLWLVGEPEKCATAWQTMKKFSELFGLEFNYSKTGNVFLTEDDFSYEDSQIAAKLPPGAVTIGFLNLDSKSGEWVIDQKKVDAHVKQLSKQLANAPSILSWVQTWNSCIGRFFSHTFGEPAKCFGRAHVDAVLETYKRMQEKLFPGSDVCEFLKGQIKDRFGVIDIPDAFIFIPEELGGLGVRNPFIGALMSRENVGSGPSDYLQTVLSDERETYNSLKHAFDSTDLQERKRRLQTNYIDAFGETLLPENSSKDLNTFLSFSEFTAHRECTSVELFKAYNALMASPPKQAIHSTQGVDTAIRTLVLAIPDGEKERGGLKEELRWILQMYESELMERCGGMSCVDKELLPLGVLTILRKRRVAWQMVL